jgi:hypothetical protein
MENSRNSLKERLDFIGLDERSRDVQKSLKPLIGAAIGSALTVFTKRSK